LETRVWIGSRGEGDGLWKVEAVEFVERRGFVAAKIARSKISVVVVKAPVFVIRIVGAVGFVFSVLICVVLSKEVREGEEGRWVRDARGKGGIRSFVSYHCERDRMEEERMEREIK
jgi:hypothetical protein